MDERKQISNYKLPDNILLKHKKLNKTMIVIEVFNYHKAKDKKFLYKILDDIYNVIFTDLEVYDLILWKTNHNEHISFYIDSDNFSLMIIETIREQLKLIKETEEYVRTNLKLL